MISLFFVATATEAQNKIQVTSFNRMETDVTARITAPQRDQNGEVCALIRIVTTEKDLMFEPDALGIVSRENKPGEIWLYIPRGARRISIMHDKFGVLRNYFYPDIIEKATVYEMEIQIGDGTQQTPANTNTQLIVMRPDPATADIYIDDEKVPTENGLFTATMKTPKGGNNSGGEVANGKFIKRLRYPDSEVSNPNRPKDVDTQGTRLWWDVADTNDDGGNYVTPNNFR